MLYTICAPYAGLQISKIEVHTKEELDSYITRKGTSLFKIEEYGIDFEALFGYIYAWQHSPEVLQYKVRKEVVSMQTNHIPLEKCLEELETKTITINELLPKNISNLYSQLSRLVLNSSEV